MTTASPNAMRPAPNWTTAGMTKKPQSSFRCEQVNGTMDALAKKRMQNRNAQRLYRQRQRSRMEELEAKVRMHEGRAVPPASSDGRVSRDVSQRPRNSPTQTKPVEQSHVLAQARPASLTLSPKTRTRTSVPSLQGPQLAAGSFRQDQAWRLGTTGTADFVKTECTRGAGVRRRRSRRSTRSDNESKQGNSATSRDLEAKRGLQESEKISPSQNSCHDQDAFPSTQQYGQILQVPEFNIDFQFPPSGLDDYERYLIDSDPVAAARRGIEEDFMGQLRMSTLCDMDSMNTAQSSSEPTIPDSVLLQSPYAPATTMVNFDPCDVQPILAPNNRCQNHPLKASIMADSHVNDMSVRSCDEAGDKASKGEWMNYVADWAKSAGFHDFDEAVQAYYNSRFSELSDLGATQRLSRNRHLPEVLAKMRRASRRWTKWERRGLEQEMVRCAEEMLKRECHDFYSTRNKQAEGTMGGVTTRTDAFLQTWAPELGRITPPCLDVELTSQVPNLFALLLGICNESGGPAPEHCLHVISSVVATICGSPSPLSPPHGRARSAEAITRHAHVVV